MLGYAAFIGPPHFSDVLDRPRLIRLLGTAGSRPVVLSAASGYGKTVAAAQYAVQQALPVVWFSVQGETPDYCRAVRALYTTLHRGCHDATIESVPLEELERQCSRMLAEQCPQGALVVLDDVGAPSGRDAYQLVDRLLAGLRHARIGLVMTTRQSAVPDCPALLIDHHMLAFSADEVRATARLLGRQDLAAGTVDALGELGGGHPALTTTLLAASSVDGVERLPHEARLIAKRIAEQQLSNDERRVLSALSFLKRASFRDLLSLGFERPSRLVAGLSAAIPIVRIVNYGDGLDAVAVAHDLLHSPDGDCPMEQLVSDLELHVPTVMDVLARNGDEPALKRMAKAWGDEAAAWLETNRDVVMKSLGHQGVLDLIDTFPLGALVRRSNLMLLWSTVLLELGRMEEAVSKARIAYRLACQDSDHECLARSAATVVTGLSLSGHPNDAWQAGVEFLSGFGDSVQPWMRCELLASLASAAATSARTSDFRAVEAAALEESQSDPERSKSAMRRIRRARATLSATAHSDWIGASEALSPLLRDDSDDDLLSRTAVRGNMAFCLVELGRLSRARALLSSILDRTVTSADASFLPALAMVMAAEGQTTEAVRTCMRGIELAVEAGDEMDAHLSRVALASLERLDGQLSASLETAEQAYEGLGRLQVAGFRWLAACEVACSLMALEDVSAAQRWLRLADECPFDSAYRSLRAAMVMAECDRRQGDVSAGIERLRHHRKEVHSDNSNWQMAMYARTFPHMLGMLAQATGAAGLPVHMLRMILPEHAENALRAARGFMDTDEWHVLAGRSLGTKRFEEFLERGGRPICRVRLFGGFEVTVDEHEVQERDWTKRKGRMIFAMLVGRRGQDVARDQILEHLWPEMDPTRAKNNFYVAWSSMKSALRATGSGDNSCPYVQSSRGRCRVIREWVRSDLDDFEDLMAQARHADAEGRRKDAIAAYVSIASVYRGDLLPGDVYDDWFTPLREKYRMEFLDAMVRAAELLLSDDDPYEAVVLARRGLAVDPYREDLYQAALKSHIAAGQRSAAIETFIQCKSQLADELGLDPSSGTLELYQEVLSMEERPRYDAYGMHQ